MAAIRKGASKLGVEIHWSYAFVPRGTAADTTADAIYLDTGGRLAPGVIDQHSSETPGPGTADLVLRHPELAYSHLLGPWLQRARDCHELERREWDLVIVTHEDPNFDAVVSAFLVQCLVEDGEFPPGAEGLVAYACEVELGRYKVDMNDVSTATQAIHMAYLAIQHLTGPDGETYKGDQLWAWRLQRGIELVRLCLRKLYEGGSPPPSRAQDLHPCSEAATAWAQEDAFKDASELLERDQEAYRSDLRNKTEEGAETQVTLPAADGSGTIQVRGVILLKPPDSKLNRYWARAEGCPFFVCPYHLEGHDPQDHGEEDWYPHVYISIDPTWEEVDAPHRRPTLEGLAAVLDDAEAKLGGGAHAHRSWYDGSDYGHTIVWAPHDGTRLPYSRVRKLVESSFWTMPVQQYDLTLMYVGVDDAVTEGRPTPPRHPDDLSLVMKRYLRDSATYMASPRTRDLTTSRQFEPPEVSVRRLPFGTCPPVTMLRLDHRKVPLRLDDLAAYCRKIHEGEFKSRPLYVYARGSASTPPAAAPDAQSSSCRRSAAEPLRSYPGRASRVRWSDTTAMPSSSRAQQAGAARAVSTS